MVDRFWSKVRFPENIDDCWEWTGGKDRDGYGRFFMIKGKSSLRASRLSWEYYFGPIPAGLQVLHKCDNPACVNPNHLFLGTQADNVHDMINKNRQINLRGSQHGNSVLTEENIDEILVKASSGEYKSIHDICQVYNVDRMTIRLILQGKI